MAISYKRDSKKLYKLTFMMGFFVSCYLEKKMEAFGDSCRHSQLKAIERSCRSMAAALGVQEQGARRIPMQDWLRFPLYLLRRSHWELLRSGERQYNKIEGIAQHLVSCGLRSPSERTQTTMCALIVHTSPEEGAMRLEEDGVRAQALLSTVKAVLKAKILRAKTLGTPLVGKRVHRRVAGVSGRTACDVSTAVFRKYCCS